MTVVVQHGQGNDFVFADYFDVSQKHVNFQDNIASHHLGDDGSVMVCFHNKCKLTLSELREMVLQLEAIYMG